MAFFKIYLVDISLICHWYEALLKYSNNFVVPLGNQCVNASLCSHLCLRTNGTDTCLCPNENWVLHTDNRTCLGKRWLVVPIPMMNIFFTAFLLINISWIIKRLFQHYLQTKMNVCRTVVKVPVWVVIMWPARTLKTVVDSDVNVGIVSHWRTVSTVYVSFCILKKMLPYWGM